MNNQWFFVMIAHSNLAKTQIILNTNAGLTPAVRQITFTNNWVFDNTFRVQLGGNNSDLILFNGIIARASLILDIYASDVVTLSTYRYGIPRKLTRAQNGPRLHGCTQHPILLQQSR
jgi:hypothetical protein